jgi:hypothetical protein
VRSLLVVLAVLAVVAVARETPARAGETPRDELARVRASPELADDPGAIDALARDLTGFPSPLRVEARMLVAGAWLGRMHRPDDAIGILRAVVDDPEADPLTSRLAERQIVEAMTDAGRLTDALAEASAHAGRVDPSVTAHVKVLLRRRFVRGTAFGVLGLLAALAALSFVRAIRDGRAAVAIGALRRTSLLAAGFAAYLAIAGGVLASGYEAGNGAPFALLAVIVLPLVLLARAWGAVGSPRRLARGGRAAICALGVLAAAFLLLDFVNPTYLDGFGL